MKNNWTKPQLNTYGNVEQLTQRSKTLGRADGVVLVSIPGIPDGTPIGS